VYNIKAMEAGAISAASNSMVTGQPQVAEEALQTSPAGVQQMPTATSITDLHHLCGYKLTWLLHRGDQG